MVTIPEQFSKDHWMSKITTADELRDIEENGLLYISQAFGMSLNWRNADCFYQGNGHQVQMVASIKEQSCSCYCWTCEGICPVAVAAWIKNWNDFACEYLGVS